MDVGCGTRGDVHCPVETRKLEVEMIEAYENLGSGNARSIEFFRGSVFVFIFVGRRVVPLWGLVDM